MVPTQILARALNFVLEENVSGTDDSGTGGTSGLARTDSNVDIQTEVNNATTAIISYVGMGYGDDATHLQYP